MSLLNAEILPIKELKFSSFRIPDYQRPYVWSVKETRQLWDDITMSLDNNKDDYRIGTIILHENNERGGLLDIVDGQQRLTTLSLMIYLLSDRNRNSICKSFLEEKQFLHKDSIDNISQNAAEIKQWIEDELDDKEIFLTYILDRCSMVVVTVGEISEAFQMFDSQNGRGLPLETYNLLKAYHIRHFENIPHDVKVTFDRKWESAAKNEKKKDYLKQVIDEQLYRSRIWTKQNPAYSFNKKNIQEFKGSNILNIKYPFQNYFKYLNFDLHNKPLKRMKNDSLLAYTQINQPIINGTNFFDYIQNYVAMYQLLFEIPKKKDDLQFFREFYSEYCSRFSKTGDFYLLELYKSLTMMVFDKFGVVGLRKYYQLLYAYVFRFRLEKKFVKYDSVAKFPAGVFAKIHDSKELLDLNFIKELALSTIKKQQNNDNNPVVEAFFSKHFQVKIE